MLNVLKMRIRKLLS